MALKGSRSWWDGRLHEQEVQTVRRANAGRAALVKCSGYRQSASYFANVPSVASRIRGELGRFTESITTKADALWERSIRPAGAGLSGDIKFVALYHRRGDAYSVGDATKADRKNPYHYCLPGKDFYANAVAAFRKRYGGSGIVYVTSSFHRPEGEDMLSRAVALDPAARLVAVDERDGVVVLAALARCDAATFSHGTFSWFVAFLTGGPVYYDPRPWVSRGCAPLAKKYHLNDARVSLRQHVPSAWLPLDAPVPAAATCRYPPKFREAYFYASKKSIGAEGAELLAFASRFSDAELAIGFNTKFLAPERKYHMSTNYSEFASHEFWVRRDGEESLQSLPVMRDAHRHSLVVRFPLDAIDGKEVVRMHVGKDAAAKWLRISEVEVCDERSEPQTLEMCTSVLDKDLTQHADHVAVWLGYHFAQGVAHATVYVDVNPDTKDASWAFLLQPVRARLRSDAHRVQFVPWRFRAKNFWSQQIAQNHCIYAARGAGTQALISTDIDEFLEPQAPGRVVDLVLATVVNRGIAAWRIVMRAVALERTIKRQMNVDDLYTKRNGRASGPLWSAKLGRGNRVGGTKSTAKLALDPALVDYISVHQVTGARGEVLSARNATGNALIMNHVRHHDHGPGPTANGPPACLAKPWAAAWALYAAHAKARG